MELQTPHVCTASHPPSVDTDARPHVLLSTHCSTSCLVLAMISIISLITIRYDTIGEINMDSKAEYTA